MLSRARTRPSPHARVTCVAGVALAAAPAARRRLPDPAPARARAPGGGRPVPRRRRRSAPRRAARSAAIRCVINQQRARNGLNRAPRRTAGSPRAANRHARRHGPPQLLQPRLAERHDPLRRARAAGWRGGVGEAIAWGCGTQASPARDRGRLAGQPAAPRDHPRPRARRRHRLTRAAPGCSGGGAVLRRARGRLGAQLAPRDSQEKPRTAEREAGGGPERRARAARHPVVADALAVDHRAREPVDQVLERQRLGGVLDHARRVVGVVEDAGDEDQRQERRRSRRRAPRRSSGSRATARRRARRSRRRRRRRRRPARAGPAASRARTARSPATMIITIWSTVLVTALPTIPAR